jgi:hypothetical protein
LAQEEVRVSAQDQSTALNGVETVRQGTPCVRNRTLMKFFEEKIGNFECIQRLVGRVFIKSVDNTLSGIAHLLLLS